MQLEFGTTEELTNTQFAPVTMLMVYYEAQKVLEPLQAVTTAIHPLTRYYVVPDEGAYVEAWQILAESVTQYRSFGHHFQLSWALACLGYVLQGLNQFSQARQCLIEALQVATESANLIGCFYALSASASFYLNQGEIKKAIEVYTVAVRYPRVGNSHWFEDMTGRHITKAAETLPSVAIIAARERGQGRDLWETVQEVLAEFKLY